MQENVFKNKNYLTVKWCLNLHIKVRKNRYRGERIIPTQNCDPRRNLGKNPGLTDTVLPVIRKQNKVLHWTFSWVWTVKTVENGGKYYSVALYFVSGFIPSFCSIFIESNLFSDFMHDSYVCIASISFLRNRSIRLLRIRSIRSSISADLSSIHGFSCSPVAQPRAGCDFTY